MTAGRGGEDVVSSIPDVERVPGSAAGTSCQTALDAAPEGFAPLICRRSPRRGALVLSLLSLAGCGLPRDSAGTLDRLQGGEIRAGITANPPWTRIADPDAGPSGVEVRLLNEFARLQGAQVRWHEDSEQDLFKALEEGELDIAIGGLTDKSGYADRAGLSQPYATIGKDNHVWAIRPGENALLLEVDRFLQARRTEILEDLVREPSP
jgi:polar amino acid transport system substrate-binding protein